MTENNILGVILAGGKSRRIGTDKSIIKLGQKTLIEHTISKIEKKFFEILIISNNKIEGVVDLEINKIRKIYTHNNKLFLSTKKGTTYIF